MRHLQKLPGSRREPPGLERTILARLPVLTVAGTAIPAFCYVLAPLFAPDGSGAEKYLTGVGIYAVATILTVWTAAFTVAIGCFIVRVMKGPAYVADRYHLIDADEPRTGPVHATRRETGDD